MTIHVAHPKPERELPEFIRKAAHDRLDVLLNQYEQGMPLWLVHSLYFASTQHAEFRLDFTLREWV